MNTVLLEHEARKVMGENGIDVVPGMFCATKEEALDAADKIGYPVVLKVVSPDVIHKSDCGGVKLNLADRQALSMAYDEMLREVHGHVPQADIKGGLVTKFMGKCREVIIGAVNDNQFGPVIMVGLGGIFVEVFKDLSFGVAPLSIDEAKEMLASLRSFPLLNGARGEKPVDLDALCRMICKVSEYVYHHHVSELDLNPVFCSEDGVMAGDVRVLLDEQERACCS